MSIVLNGGSNPSAIKYVKDGVTTNITEVWFKTSDSATPVKVWPEKYLGSCYYRWVQGTEYDSSKRSYFFRHDYKEGYTQYTGGPLAGSVANNSLIGAIYKDDDIERTMNIVKLPEDVSHMFDGAQSLRHEGNEIFNTSYVKNMSYMFKDCTLLGNLPGNGFIDLRKWDVSNVQNMEGMFLNSGKVLRILLDGWDTSNVTNMSKMFMNATTRHIYVGYLSSKWSTSKVTSSTDMFKNCSYLPNFNASVVDKTNAYVGSGGYLELSGY